MPFTQFQQLEIILPFISGFTASFSYASGLYIRLPQRNDLNIYLLLLHNCYDCHTPTTVL